MVGSRGVVEAARAAILQGDSEGVQAMRLLLACCRAVPAVCQAAALAELPQVRPATLNTHSLPSRSETVGCILSF